MIVKPSRAALALTLLAAAGCSPGAGDPDAQPGKTASAIRIEYWTPFSGGDNRFMTEMVERFNREQDGIRIIQTNSRLDDYYSRLKTAILSGNAPDVAINHATNLPQFVQNGYIENLTLPAAEVGLDWDVFNPNIMASAIYDGHSYAVPLDTHALVMYYNKEHLGKAGALDASGRPVFAEGAEGFAAFLRRIKEAVPPDVAPLAQPGTRIDSVWLWWSLYNQIDGGGAFYDETGSKTTLNNAQALEALEFVHGLYTDGLIPPDINDAFKMFYDGRAAVLITGMWGTGAFEHAPGLDFGVVPLPTLYDAPAVWGDSHALVIPTKHGMTDDKRKAIMTFAKWMVEHGEKWAEAGHVPSMSRVVQGDEFNALDYRSDYAAAANDVKYWPRHVRQWSMTEVLIAEFERMNYSRQTPEQALRNAAARIDAELKKG
ncbi:ABC transporter substrate-binding protein [Paenibacillaceae bacterium WGS1546]|uniref:ABC transporter substrate-binding protein n=1 Tax=Cohnella sp. WGS1546 TaxID=3366810 RepID=UPI00372D74C2